jgi:CSLREA domain-containing protein
MRAGLSFISRGRLAIVAAAAIGPFLVMCPALASASAGSAAASLSFRVNSTADSHDANLGDRKCADSKGRCTLRAAIEEASAQPAGTSISISVPSGTYDLTLGSLEESANTISVKGASAQSTVVDADNSFRVLQVESAVTASLTGLTITGGNAGRTTGYGGAQLGQTDDQ